MFLVVDIGGGFWSAIGLMWNVLGPFLMLFIGLLIGFTAGKWMGSYG